MNTNTAMQNEQEDNDRLRKADEFVACCIQDETDAIKALAEAGKRLARAREKKNLLFEECQNRAVARRKSGEIEWRAGY